MSTVLKTKPLTPVTRSSYRLAKEIFGNDFISPELLETRFGSKYSSQQLSDFEQNLPHEADLSDFKENGFVIMAGPVRDTSLYGIHRLNKEHFFSKDFGWYLHERQTFATSDIVKAGEWLIFRKEPVFNSFSRDYYKQLQIIREFSGLQRLPNVAEVCWFLIICKAVIGIEPLANKTIRTSSKTTEENHRLHVTIGDSSKGGIRICTAENYTEDPSLGITTVLI